MRVALAVLLLASAALAQPSRQGALEAAVRAHDQLEFERCLEALAAVDLNDPAFARAALYRGLCHFNLGQTSAARAAFRQALERAPDETLPADVSPKVVELFRDVKGELARQAAASSVPPPVARAPSAPVPAPFVAEDPAPVRPLAGPAVLGGLAVLAAGAATSFALQARAEEGSANGARFTSDAASHAQAAVRAATLANVGWVAAGVLGLAAGTWFAAPRLLAPHR